jgi:hypothetical protein
VALSGRNIRKRSAVLAATTTDADDAVESAAAPTKAEFDAVVALVNELKDDHNALVAALQQ